MRIKGLLRGKHGEALMLAERGKSQMRQRGRAGGRGSTQENKMHLTFAICQKQKIFLRLYLETRWYWGKIFHVLSLQTGKRRWLSEERVLEWLLKALSVS